MPLHVLKTFVVTGANKAVELEWVRRMLVRPGHQVLAGVTDPDAIKEFASEYAGLQILPLRPEDPASLEHWADAVASSTQHVDMFIENAGMATSAADIRVTTSPVNSELLGVPMSAMPVMQALQSRHLVGGYGGQTMLATVSQAGQELR